MEFVLSYILFYHVWLLSLRSLLFSNERQEEIDPEGRGDGEELGVMARGETVLRIYCMRKESIFNKRGKGPMDLPTD